MLKSFEDMCSVDVGKIKEALADFAPADVVKACMGASPKVNQSMSEIFPEIDFIKVRETIGSVEITEVENIKDKIVNSINMLIV